MEIFGTWYSPEKTDLLELSGSALTPAFNPKMEIFTDKAHIARARVHLTVRQMSKLTMSQIIKTAMKAQVGAPYSVANPMIRNREPVADVHLADQNGNAVNVTVNVRTGQIVKY